MAMTHKYKRFP